VVEGIQTNLAFHRRLIDHPDFIEGRLDTHFLERFSTDHAPSVPPPQN
jgi:acetyl-CoA carboxylase biotin carboxylase subunit